VPEHNDGLRAGRSAENSSVDTKYTNTALSSVLVKYFKFGVFYLINVVPVYMRKYSDDFKILMDLHILRPPECEKVISGKLYFCTCG
jgi:hypothetical protein